MKTAAFVAASLVLAAAPASAAVYSFEPLSQLDSAGHPVSLLLGMLQFGITVSDNQVRTGHFGLSAIGGDGHYPVTLSGDVGAYSGLSFDGVADGSKPFLGWFSVSMAFSPTGAVTAASLVLLGELDDYRIDLASGSALATGTFKSDGVDCGMTSRPCTLTGVFLDPPLAPVHGSVPEPASLGLLGMGLAGLLASRPKNRVAAEAAAYAGFQTYSESSPAIEGSDQKLRGAALVIGIAVASTMVLAEVWAVHGMSALVGRSLGFFGG